jgi:hypothetical protein
METPIPAIPNSLLQDLCNIAQARFTAETGRASKVTIDLAFPDGTSPPSFTVVARVTDNASGERHVYTIDVAAHSVH